MLSWPGQRRCPSGGLDGLLTGDAGWRYSRPPNIAITAEQQASLFAAWDASGMTLPKAA